MKKPEVTIEPMGDDVRTVLANMLPAKREHLLHHRAIGGMYKLSYKGYEGSITVGHRKDGKWGYKAQSCEPAGFMYGSLEQAMDAAVKEFVEMVKRTRREKNPHRGSRTR